MRRDFELVRLILLEVEGEESVDLSAYSDEQVIYHKGLVKEAGLADASYSLYNGTTNIPSEVVLSRLTWEGHEFLDKIRSEKTWNQAKGLLKEKGVSLSFEAVKIALSEAIKMILS